MEIDITPINLASSEIIDSGQDLEETGDLLNTLFTSTPISLKTKMKTQEIHLENTIIKDNITNETAGCSAQKNLDLTTGQNMQKEPELKSPMNKEHEKVHNSWVTRSEKEWQNTEFCPLEQNSEKGKQNENLLKIIESLKERAVKDKERIDHLQERGDSMSELAEDFLNMFEEQKKETEDLERQWTMKEISFQEENAEIKNDYLNLQKQHFDDTERWDKTEANFLKTIDEFKQEKLKEEADEEEEEERKFMEKEVDDLLENLEVMKQKAELLIQVGNLSEIIENQDNEKKKDMDEINNLKEKISSLEHEIDEGKLINEIDKQEIDKIRKVIEEVEEDRDFYKHMYLKESEKEQENNREILKMKDREIDDLKEQLSAFTKKVQQEDCSEQDYDRGMAIKPRTKKKVNPKPKPGTSKQSKRRKRTHAKKKQEYFSDSSNESSNIPRNPFSSDEDRNIPKPYQYPVFPGDTDYEEYFGEPRKINLFSDNEDGSNVTINDAECMDGFANFPDDRKQSDNNNENSNSDSISDNSTNKDNTDSYDDKKDSGTEEKYEPDTVTTPQDTTNKEDSNGYETTDSYSNIQSDLESDY